jgi:hypothetical protein
MEEIQWVGVRDMELVVQDGESPRFREIQRVGVRKMSC